MKSYKIHLKDGNIINAAADKEIKFNAHFIEIGDGSKTFIINTNMITLIEVTEDANNGSSNS